MSLEAAALQPGFAIPEIQWPGLLERRGGCLPVAFVLGLTVVAGGIIGTHLNGGGGDFTNLIPGSSSSHNSHTRPGNSQTTDPQPDVPCAQKFTGPIVTKLTTDLKAEARAAVHKHVTPGGEVVVTCGQEIIVKFGYGTTRSGRGKPDPDETTYDVKSVTKAMTGYTMLALEQDGRLNRNDKASKYFKQFSKSYIQAHHRGDPRYALKPQVTIGQLASYSAGLAADGSDYTSMIGHTRGQHLVDRIADRPLTYPPGQGGAYSNGSLLLAGAANEIAASQPLYKYVVSDLAGPAGADGDQFYPQARDCAEASCRTNDRLARAKGNYAGHDGWRPTAVAAAKTLLFPIAGDGNYNGHRFAKPGLTLTMTTPTHRDFAFGMFGNNDQYCGVLSDDDSPHLACKYGDQGSAVMYDRDTGIGFVGLVDGKGTAAAKKVNKAMLQSIGSRAGFIKR